MENPQYDTSNFLHFLHEQEIMSPAKIKWKFFLKQLSELDSSVIDLYLTKDQIQDILIFCFLWKRQIDSRERHEDALKPETQSIKQLYKNLSPYSGPPNKKFKQVLDEQLRKIQNRRSARNRPNRSGASARNSKRYNETEHTSSGSKSYTTSSANRSRANNKSRANRSTANRSRANKSRANRSRANVPNQSKIEEERKKHIDFITSSFNINDDSPMAQSERLSHIFNSDIDNILLELNSGSKKGHWAWWIFPTEHVGRNDPLFTRVTKKTINEFVDYINLDKWKQSIRGVINILRSDKRSTLDRDIGRIEEFCLFWNNDDNVEVLNNPKLNWIPGHCAELMNAIYNI